MGPHQINKRRPKCNCRMRFGSDIERTGNTFIDTTSLILLMQNTVSHWLSIYSWALITFVVSRSVPMLSYSITVVTVQRRTKTSQYTNNHESKLLLLAHISRLKFSSNYELKDKLKIPSYLQADIERKNS